MERASLIGKAKDLNRLIASIGKQATKLQADIHLACLSAAMHVAEHGNTTPLNDLCKIAANVTHNNAVMRWFDEFCPFVTYSSKEKKFSTNAMHKAILDEKGVARPEQVDAYWSEKLENAPTYVEFSPPPAFKPFDVVAMLKSIVNKAGNLTEEELADERNHLEGLDKVKALLVSMGQSIEPKAKSNKVTVKRLAPAKAAEGEAESASIN